YELYVHQDIAAALSAGAMPTDVLAGFAQFRETLSATGAAKRLQSAIRSRATDAFDTHPALAERTAFLERIAAPAPSRRGDAASAATLLATDVSAWLCDATFGLFERPVTLSGPAPCERMAWQEIGARV